MGGLAVWASSARDAQQNAQAGEGSPLQVNTGSIIGATQSLAAYTTRQAGYIQSQIVYLASDLSS